MIAVEPSVLERLEASFAEHPWRTLGSAVLLGAWLGLEVPHIPRSRIARAVFATIGAATIRVAREAVLLDLVGRALSRRAEAEPHAHARCMRPSA